MLNEVGRWAKMNGCVRRPQRSDNHETRIGAGLRSLCRSISPRDIAKNLYPRPLSETSCDACCHGSIQLHTGLRDNLLRGRRGRPRGGQTGYVNVLPDMVRADNLPISDHVNENAMRELDLAEPIRRIVGAELWCLK